MSVTASSPNGEDHAVPTLEHVQDSDGMRRAISSWWWENESSYLTNKFSKESFLTLTGWKFIGYLHSALLTCWGMCRPIRDLIIV